jgi:uncharacterized membrane protein YoaK (UPF0700 family)
MPRTEDQFLLVRAQIEASVWSGFVVGAGLSGMAGSHFPLWAALLPPFVVMMALGLFGEWGTPSFEKKIASSISGEHRAVPGR